METATKQQLLTIALHENCSLDLKWQAVAELEYRKWHDDYLPKLLSMWNVGKSINEIAIELDLPRNVIVTQIAKYNLYGKGGMSVQRQQRSLQKQQTI